LATDNIERQAFQVALLFGDDGSVALYDKNTIVPRHHMGIVLRFGIPTDLLVYDGSRGCVDIAAMPNISIVVETLHLVIDGDPSK